MGKWTLRYLVVMTLAVLGLPDQSSFGLPMPGVFGGPAAGGGGGPILVARKFRSTGLDQLATALGVPKLHQPIYAMGGCGYGFFGNVRVGGLGVGGEIKSTEIVQGINHELLLNYGFGGFLPEYIEKRGIVTLSFGCMLGGGMFKIVARENAVEVANSRKGFFYLEPTFGLKIKIVPFASLQAWLGYGIIASDKLVVQYHDRLYRIKSMEMTGLHARLGLIFGADL